MAKTRLALRAIARSNSGPNLIQCKMQNQKMEDQI